MVNTGTCLPMLYGTLVCCASDSTGSATQRQHRKNLRRNVTSSPTLQMTSFFSRQTRYVVLLWLLFTPLPHTLYLITPPNSQPLFSFLFIQTVNYACRCFWSLFINSEWCIFFHSTISYKKCYVLSIHIDVFFLHLVGG